MPDSHAAARRPPLLSPGSGAAAERSRPGRQTPVGQTPVRRAAATLSFIAVGFAVALLVAALVLALAGTGKSGLGAALRLTARWSFALFWLAYVAGPLATLFGPRLAPLARRGREFGLAFAAAHLVHLGLVVWLYRVLDRLPLTGALLVFFSIGIVWTYLLAALSFGTLAQALGPRLWRLLRVVGMNYILLAFGYDFVLAPLRGDLLHQGFVRNVEYLPFTVLTIAAPLLRLAADARRRRRLRGLPA